MKLNPLFFRVFAVFLLVFCISGHVHSQNSKKVKQLKDQKTQLQKNLKKSQQDLAKTGKEVKNGQSYLHHIDRQLEDRLEHIQTMEVELENLEKEMTLLRSDMRNWPKRNKNIFVRFVFPISFPKCIIPWYSFSVPRILPKCIAAPVMQENMLFTSTILDVRSSRSRDNSWMLRIHCWLQKVINL